MQKVPDAMHKVLNLISSGADLTRCRFLLSSRVRILIKGADLRKMRVLDQVKVRNMQISLKGAEIWLFFAKGAEKCNYLHYIAHICTLFPP